MQNFNNLFHKRTSIVIFFKGFAFTETLSHKIIGTDKTLGNLIKLATVESPQYAVLIAETARVEDMLSFFGYTPYITDTKLTRADLSDLSQVTELWRKKGEDMPKTYKDMIKTAFHDLAVYDEPFAE